MCRGISCGMTGAIPAGSKRVFDLRRNGGLIFRRAVFAKCFLRFKIIQSADAERSVKRSTSNKL